MEFFIKKLVCYSVTLQLDLIKIPKSTFQISHETLEQFDTIEEIEDTDEGVNPNIIGIVRASMAFKLKQVGRDHGITMELFNKERQFLQNFLFRISTRQNLSCLKV